MQSGVVIRSIGQGDAAPVAAVTNAACRKAYAFFGWNRTIEQSLESLRGKLGEWSHAALLEKDNGIVGMIGMRPEFIDWLFVHPDQQGKGFGSALMAEARRIAPQRIELHCAEGNAPARRFYVSQGFHVFGARMADNIPIREVLYEWRAAARLKDIAIRDYHDDDFDAVAELMNLAARKAFAVLGWANLPLEVSRARIREVEADWPIRRVAVSGGAVRGFLALKPGRIDQLFIHPDWQRRGIGEALSGDARRAFPAGLHLECASANTGARSFYERMRYVESGRLPHPTHGHEVIRYTWKP